MNPLAGKDIIRATQFTKEEVELVMETAKTMRGIVQKSGSADLLRGKMMTALFYEPSSRTFGSFIAAMQRLGGGVIPLQGVAYSSVSKGESLEDTVRTFASYSDVLVIRYPHVGGASVAADMLDIPVINAGDGNGEHPTQAMLDVFTIASHMDISGCTVTLVGDLLNGRTVHSLIDLLVLYKPKTINLVAPSELHIPESYLSRITSADINVSVTDRLDDVLGGSDVLYVTRVQKERFRNLDVYERLKNRYIITNDLLKMCKKSMILMHPFPRVGEIAAEVDSDPRALYLREQIQNGMFVRMALLSLVLGK